ncbi:NADP-dependent phosphogluconate dehydrogenase [Salinicoccus sp. ID82-1]|uniref:6-phosphogluconate dehydrogenase, decarboxylating n=1 Tax=Salinicoccus cyprini TaxID=2493691 RepID=A0A558AZ54_9STAP|nr:MULTISPECIES: NADP-dependent phosphogluconate dehydrogenase [Salinicoccus]MCG1009057.1 NADP-dependent phosphogluconate dehydrogenase [Salinicoccus sp. ID82-1]TVT29504.1 NADP-dependent phosphogluconate dehydrogenase [Salinicoccus cyprini]
MIYDIGVIGLGVMGTNIAKNMSRNGFEVITFDFYDDVRENRMNELKEENVDIASSLEAFINSLKKPRNILLLVKAGEVTDMTIERITPYLEEGDTLIDGGNEQYENTRRRNKTLTEKGVNFIGMGVSGGEEGALNGPSLMPGGQREAYDNVSDILEKIAAKADDGKPCVTYIGSDGSGHYVKMIHNGIEYADMELIAESYYFMKHGLDMSNDEMSKVFDEWNKGDLNSYLIEITARILEFKNEDGNYVLDLILDKAGQKGTGKWTGIEGLKLGIPLSLITDSVFVRCLSSLVEERRLVSEAYNSPMKSISADDKATILEDLKNALYISKLMCYSQGFRLLREASEIYDWNLKLGEISMIWRKGCIIRAQFLEEINRAYENAPDQSNLLLDDYFRNVVQSNHPSLRKIGILAIENEIPMPAFLSALSYFDSMKQERVSSNMIQAQRDYFGAHTYERIDQPGIFHTDWQ